ncbi:hypothetical protein [Nitrospira defluvii]|uniref:Uncharacterized protein n=1 Tax=Nitrospira defluvii TaxID=330214 RepID=A0ABM8RZ67_9BACT|nr:hypothetical protein [Nitrospira defluvii]CAE6779448.1 hypothetical protein NSPZN2_40681 [Nitrospira defluvii]
MGKETLPAPEKEYLKCHVVGPLQTYKGERCLPVVCKRCPKDRAEVRLVKYDQAFIDKGGKYCCGCKNREIFSLPDIEYPKCVVVSGLLDKEGRPHTHGKTYIQVVCLACLPDRAQPRLVEFTHAFVNSGGSRCRSCASGNNRLQHGMRETRTYRCWQGMLARVRHYPYYLKKGIGLETPEWVSFPRFLQDMGEIPDEKVSLDRINGSRGYGWIIGPDGRLVLNCRWATAEEQANNMCTNVIITVDGVSLTAMQAARKYDVGYSAFLARIHAGESGDDAIAALKAREHTESLAEIARREGISYNTFRAQIFRGKSVEDALASMRRHATT